MQVGYSKPAYAKSAYAAPKIVSGFIVCATRQPNGAAKHGGGKVSLDNAFALIEGHPGCLIGSRGGHPPLLWAGEYDISVTKFENYLKSIRYPPSEWVLKGMFARIVRDKVGFGTQRRNRVLATQLAAPRETEFEDSQFIEAIQVDGLCGLAWFNQAASEVRARNYENSAICFTAAALCQPNDLEAWCSAIGSAINCRRPDLLAHVMSAAYRVRGEQFSKALFKYINQQPAEFPKQTVLERLGEIVAAIPTSQRQRTIRVHSRKPSPAD